MKMNYLRTVGIDISKDKFDVFIIRFVDGSKVTEKSITFQFNNEGLEEFVKLLEPNDLCVMEATGCYHHRLVRVLYEREVAQAIINPKHSHHYTKMLGSITKTDSQDAMRLAHFGREYADKLPLFKMPTEKELQAKALYMDIQAVKKDIQVHKNRLHSRLLSLYSDNDQNIKNLISMLEAHLENLEQQLDVLIKAQYEEDYNLLIKIPGVGKTCATAFIMAYRSFILTAQQPNAKAFAKHLGLAPTIVQSGKRKAKSRLGRSADPALLSALFMGVKSAITTTKNDNPMKTFAKGLIDRAFPFNKACIAAVHKLVRIAWAVLTTRKPYQPDYVSTKPQLATQKQNFTDPNKILNTA
jgi:transposase